MGSGLFWKPIVQLVTKFPAFCETRKFIKACTTVRHLFKSWARSIQFMLPSHFLKIHFSITCHLGLGLPSALYSTCLLQATQLRKIKLEPNRVIKSLYLRCLTAIKFLPNENLYLKITQTLLKNWNLFCNVFHFMYAIRKWRDIVYSCPVILLFFSFVKREACWSISYSSFFNLKYIALYSALPGFSYIINPLKAELNPICCLLALLGAHHFLHVSRIRVKLLTLRLLISYMYGAPILDVSRSHTTTQHSR